MEVEYGKEEAQEGEVREDERYKGTSVDVRNHLITISSLPSISSQASFYNLNSQTPHHAFLPPLTTLHVGCVIRGPSRRRHQGRIRQCKPSHNRRQQRQGRWSARWMLGQVDQLRELWTDNYKVLAWEGQLLDANGKLIGSCAATKKTAGVLNDFTIPCPNLGFGLSAHTRPDGNFVIRIGRDVMSIPDKRCKVEEWDLNAKPVPVS
jgi:hypothetical protein